MRILAVFCVVILHVSAAGFHRYPVSMPEWQAFNIVDGAVRFCVPLLVMISGTLFLNPDKEIRIKTLYQKYILRIVIAFFFWSAFYAIYALEPYKGIAPSSSDWFLTRLLTGEFHLWFLFMIAGLYIIVPFLRKITAYKKLTEYFLLLALIFTMIIPALLLIKIPKYEVFTGNLENMNFFFVLGFTVYFVAGYYFSVYPVKKTARLVIYILGIVSVILTIILTGYLSGNNGVPTEALHGFLLPNIAVFTLAVFLFLKSVFENKEFKESAVRTILLISKCSFGIYLVHAFFMILFFTYIDFYQELYNPIILIPVISVAIYACSFVVSFLLNKIPVLNRYIV